MGAKLIIEPMAGPSNIVELLAQWSKVGSLGQKTSFPILLPCLPRRKIFRKWLSAGFDKKNRTNQLNGLLIAVGLEACYTF